MIPRTPWRPCSNAGCRRWTLVLAASLTLMAGQVRGAEDEPTVAEPEVIRLTTKDGVVLRCTYFAGGNGKQTVPVILLHGWNGQRTDMEGLASYLQTEGGHAVIVPDLRGHGDSTVQRMAGQEDQKLDRQRFRASDLAAMVTMDLEAVKRHLMVQNNAGALNIELLCVVGTEMGSVIGLNWVAKDWSWPQLPTVKQGQDVKAFVLISPEFSAKGLPITQALAHEIVRGKLSAMIVFGKNDPGAASTSRRIYTAFKRFHPAIPTDPEEREKKQDLFLVELDTSLQGTKLLSTAGLNVPQLIAQFIDLRLVRKQEDFPWRNR